LVIVLPVLSVVPATPPDDGHLVHTLAAALLYVPLAHAMHDVLVLLALEYLPASHGLHVQLSAPVAPLACDDLYPAWHLHLYIGFGPSGQQSSVVLVHAGQVLVWRTPLLIVPSISIQSASMPPVLNAPDGVIHPVASKAPQMIIDFFMISIPFCFC